MPGRQSTPESAPPQTEMIKNVPNDHIEQVRVDFRDSGASKIEIVDNGDGTSDILATFSS